MGKFTFKISESVVNGEREATAKSAERAFFHRPEEISQKFRTDLFIILDSVVHKLIGSLGADAAGIALSTRLIFSKFEQMTNKVDHGKIFRNSHDAGVTH